MNHLINDPTPVFQAIGFFVLLSVAGIASALFFLQWKENSIIRKKIGNDSVEWILKDD